ncbi:MAG: hypothetical protein JOS17DRAFT_763506 [Linnemannia elongata]|nr:MAG: hypothetical protein JOS17DRAFT_763506 [Linnemannia elongata]
MVSIRSLPLLAIVAILASVSALPAVEPPTQAEAAAPVAAPAADTFPPVGYPSCSTRPQNYMRCWEWCGKKGYWWVEPNCCCP